MTGATNPNPDVIDPLNSIAYKDDSGSWHAGPDSSIPQGQFISESKANQIRHIRQRTQAVKSSMRTVYQERGYRSWDSVPADERDEIERAARERTQEAFDALEELEQADEDMTPRERERRRRVIRQDAFDS